MGMTYQQAQLYTRTQVQHDIRDKSPIGLVVLYYDTAILKLKMARERIERGDLIGKGEALSQAVAIIAELRAVLDKEKGGDIARKLDDLYTFMLDQLTLANFKNEGHRISHVIELMNTLHVSWRTLAQQAASAERSALQRSDAVLAADRAAKG